MSINVCTTFNKDGLDLYGQTFLNTYAKNVDKKIKLTVYAENCLPENPDPTQILVLDQHESLPELLAFKQTWHDVPMANGTCPFPQKRPRDWDKKFKWDAIRFSNKVYAVFDACERHKGDWIVWMDADTVVHSPWSYDDFKAFLKDECWITYVGRGKGSQTWPECGFYGIDTSSDKALEFVDRFKWMYNNANIGIFKLDEWHDSYVFGYVLNHFKSKYPNVYDVTAEMYMKEARTGGGGHPIINCDLGKYIDHLKGDRKNRGASALRDLLVKRVEKYWRNIK
jgi:hypothetical protein